jgi:hypothetical protein
MMAKRPDDRYVSMVDVIADLEQVERRPGAHAGVNTRHADSAGDETVTAVGHLAPERRARWRLPQGIEPPAPSVAPAPSSKPSTASLLRSLSLTQRLGLRAEYASLPRVRTNGARPRPRRRLWQFFAACGASALLMVAGLVYAARAERSGSIALKVYPPSASVEILDAASRVKQRHAADGEVTLRAAPGEYRVRVTKHGFLPYQRQFILEPGGRTQIYAVLQRR